MKFCKNYCFIFLIIFVSGCAANINEAVHNAINTDEKSSPETIYLDISHSKSISENKDLVRSMNELRELISKDSTVVKSKSSSDLAVNISIENFRYVSGFGRFMAGVMVGDAELKVNIKITELSSGNIIGESVFDTQSAFSEGIFGATTSRQLEAMAIKITQYIKSTDKNS